MVINVGIVYTHRVLTHFKTHRCISSLHDRTFFSGIFCPADDCGQNQKISDKKNLNYNIYNP